MLPMFREFFRFGSICFRVETPDPLEPSRVCAPFASAEGDVCHTIYVEYHASLPTAPPDASDNGTTYRWQRGSARYTLNVYADKPFSLCVTDGDKSELWLTEQSRGQTSGFTVFAAADLFDIFAARGMLILHSSYVLRAEGDALLFSGVSGIGKSTQAELWRRYASARVINGDRALVDVNAGYAHGIFYSGTSRICENVSAPIRAVILPEQAAVNRVSVPAKREAFMRILNQCAYYPWDADSASAMTELAARLVSSLPVLRLDCRKDEGAVTALQNELMKTGR